MNRLLLRVLVLAGSAYMALSSVATAGIPTHAWSEGFGDFQDQSNVSVVTDASGNVIVAGTFSGTVDFGGSPLTSAGGSDVFVAKFSPTGVHLWSQRYGDSDYQGAMSVATDPSGNVIVVGYAYGAIDFGGGTLTSAGLGDIFVAKFNSAGVHQWSQRFGDASDQLPLSVVSDPSGNVVITGQFYGSVDFGGGNLTSAGGLDFFVTKFDSGGAHQWSQRYGDASDQTGQAVATDASGNVIVTGTFYGSLDFGGSILTSSGGEDIFLVKFSSGGAPQWDQRYGDANGQYSRSVTTDPDGNVILTGYFYGTVNFGGSLLTATGSSDVFVAKFNSAGVHQWSQRYGDAYPQTARSVTTNASGDVVITGDFYGTIDFGGNILDSAGGGTDIFVAKFNSLGGNEWSYRFGDVNGQMGQCVAMDGFGNVAVAGIFEGTVDFGGGDLTSAGQSDVFLAKFSGDSPLITSIVDIGNDQGRKVKIRFNRSGEDYEGASSYVLRYDAFRRDDPAPALTSPGVAMPLDYGWTQVGSVNAYAQESYGIDVPTIGDSTVASGQYYSVFFIRAATQTPYMFYDSPPDSGYSLDNLAPGLPNNLVYVAGELSWDAPAAADINYFSVYGSNTNSFALATLIDYTVDPTMDVSSSLYTYYFATATDFSGNEGQPAVVNRLSGVGRVPVKYVLSVSAYPNPFNPSTTVRYTVPAKGRVIVAIYDTRGSHVATLVDEERTAGAYTQDWNGTNASGSVVSSGVYFARVTHNGGAKTYKMVLLK